MAAVLFPGVYDEDCTVGWENKAQKLLEDEHGEDIYKQMLANQFQDVPESLGSPMSALGIQMKIIRGLKPYTKTQRKGRRSPFPVGGAGFATIVHNPQFPKNNFFRPGRIFRVRMRHSNVSCIDDSTCDGRVAALKFCDENEGGPLDLMMYTGRVSPVHNAAHFDEYMEALGTGDKAFREWCYKSPAHLYGLLDHVRRLPVSYYDQRYYTHVIYQLIDTEGERHMARLRLCPACAVEETGRLSPNCQQTLWLATQTSVPTNGFIDDPNEEPEPQNIETNAETEQLWTVKPKDYLRTEYRKRVKTSAVQYRLQMQVRPWPQTGQQGANPCIKWNIKMYPWVDLAVVTVGLPLQQLAVCDTKMSLLNHPTCFRLPDTTSRFDFFSLGHAMSGMHSVYDKPIISMEMKRKYVVTVKTGEDGSGGTDADVAIIITGSKCRTKHIHLSNTFHDDFEAGQTDIFHIDAVDVGEVMMAKMVLSSIIKGRHWLLDYVVITDVVAEKSVRFGCYQWLTSSEPTVTLRRSESLLAQQELTPYRYLHRKHELEERRHQYKWHKEFGFPGRLEADRYEDIPRECRFHPIKDIDIKAKYMQMLSNTGVGSIKSLFDTWDPFSDSEKLSTSLLKDKGHLKKVSIHWKDDTEFGCQILNGPHPMRIRKLIAPLITFPVNDEDVKGLLDRGLTLKEEMKQGHVYMVSYPELTKLVSSINHNPQSKHFVAAPMCMLYVRSDGQLVPIAIQLDQKPGDQHMLFTPKDDTWTWLYAKMWVRLADAQLHEIEARHLKLHLVLEAFAIATMRNLPSVHPVFKLLVPHLRYMMAVNHLGRAALYPQEEGLFEKYLSVGSQFKDLLKETYRRFDLNSMNLLKNLEMRGVDSAYLLPHYFYRHDGLALWGIIKKFVRTMMILHYWTSHNVKADEEIQAWVSDLHSNGLPQWEDGTDHNVPNRLDTLEELIDLVTLIIFTASGQNAAITGPMMDIYGYPPNAPTMLVQLPPTAKNMVTAETVKLAMPSKVKTAEIMSACYALSRACKDETRLGQYPEEHFSGEATKATIEAFQEDLNNLSAILDARFEKREKSKLFAYRYLSPDKLPVSVLS